MKKNIKKDMMKSGLNLKKNYPEREFMIIPYFLIKKHLETLTLFAVQRLEDNNTVEELPSKEVMKKWWDYMKDIMETNPDNSPVTDSLEEVFHMD